MLIHYALILAIVPFVKSVDESEKLYNIIKENIAATKSWKPSQENVEFLHYNDQNIKQYPNKYDFVIVGAGSAGATLANRLSEINHWKILLLEAGVDESDFNVIPSLSTYQTLTSKVWGYQSEPNANLCGSFPGKRCDVTSGKGLGGGSSVNGMVYSRGDRSQFDTWVNYGNPGWSYEEVLPYFKKAENIQFEGDTNYRGHSGPLYVTQNKALPVLVDKIIAGGMENGFDEIDPNAKQRIGMYKMQTTTYKGKRWSTNQAYLKKAKSRKNLTILTKAFAIKILFDAKKSARELHFLHNNNTYYVRPKKEVIISAGAFNSPQLLLLSGIGPKKDLESLGINVVNDLPVGHHLGDLIFNVIVAVGSNYTHPTLSLNEALKAYTRNGSGPLGWPPAVAGQIIAPKLNGTNDPYFDIEISYGLANTALNELDPVTSLEKSAHGQIMFGLVFLLLPNRPETQGKVTLKSTKYTDFPRITVEYTDNPADTEVLYQGVDAIINLIQSKSMQEINAISLDSLLPQCHGKKDRDLSVCIVTHRKQLVFHPRGTCRMGAYHQQTVVDHHLKVHGVNKLRVVDSSVIPLTTTAGLNSLTIMIAEKIAYVIKKEHLIV